MPAVEYNLDGDSDQLVDALTKAIRALLETEKAADKATDAVEDLEKATKDASKEGKQAGSTFGDLAGTMADSADLVSSLVETLTGLYESFVGVIQRGIEAREAVKDFISAEDSERVRDLETQTERLNSALDVLAVRFTSDIKPELVNFINLVVGAADKGGDLLDTIQDIADNPWVERLQDAGDALRAIASLGLASEVEGALEGMVEHGEEVNEQLGKMKIGWIEVNKPTREQIDLFLKSEEALEKLAKEREEAAKRAAEAEKEAAAEQERRRKEALDALAAQEAQEEALADSYIQAWGGALDARLDQINKEAEAMEAAGEKAIETVDKQTAAFEAKQAARHDQIVAGLKTVQDQFVQILSEGMSLLFDMAVQDAEAAVDHVEGRLDRQRDKVERLKEQAADGDRKAAEALADEQQNLRDLERLRKDLARDAFQTQKAAKIEEAGMAVALALLQAYAQLGPIGGALSTPGLLGLFAIQMQRIESARPPAHSGAGLGADEGFMLGRLVRENEELRIVSQRGAEMIRELERGAGARGTGAARLVLADAGRSLAEVLIREAQRPGSRLGAAGAVGPGDPYRRA